MDTLDTLFLIIFPLSIICLVVGLIKPSLLIRWGFPEKRGRQQVLLTSLSCAIVSFIAFGMTNNSNTTSEAKQATQQTKAKAVSAPTLEPIPTPAPTIQQQLEIIARDTAQEHFKKMIVSPPDASGKRSVEIHFAGEENPSLAYVKIKTFDMCANLFEKIYESGMPIQEVNEIAYIQTVDKYGKSIDSPVIKMTLIAETYAKINWSNIDKLNFDKIVDKAWIHPALIKVRLHQ